MPLFTHKPRGGSFTHIIVIPITKQNEGYLGHADTILSDSHTFEL